MLNQKPLVTVYVPLFNRKTLIVEALQSVLAQTYSPLEVIICDDCSTDGSGEIVHNIISRYHGPHRVRVHRNERNLGLIGNINQVFRLAAGELIIINCDDDISVPNRVETIVARWLDYDKKPFVIYSSFQHIAKTGEALDWPVPQIIDGLAPGSVVDYFRQAQVIGCTAAYRPEVMTVFGPINHPEAHDDYVLFLRGRLLGDILSLSNSLLFYRDGGVSANHGTVKAMWVKPFRAWLESCRQVMEDLKCDGYASLARGAIDDKMACLQSLILAYEARIDLVSASLPKRLKAFQCLSRYPGGQPKSLLFLLALMPRSILNPLIYCYFRLFNKKGH